jgi:prevent-host-death family protein
MRRQARRSSPAGSAVPIKIQAVTGNPSLWTFAVCCVLPATGAMRKPRSSAPKCEWLSCGLRRAASEPGAAVSLPVDAAHAEGFDFEEFLDAVFRSPLRRWVEIDQTMVHIRACRRRADRPMQIPVTQAKGQLTELIRLAEAGEEVVLTRHGQAVVRLVPVKAAVDAETRRKILEAVRKSGRGKARSGESAARSQDFLYGADGLPE